MLESLKLFYVGGEAEKLAMSVMKNKIPKSIVLDFYKTMKKAYIQTTKYLQQKYPIENPYFNPYQGTIKICT